MALLLIVVGAGIGSLLLNFPEGLIVGAVLVGIVVVKLFVVELSAVGTLQRIVSFISCRAPVAARRLHGSAAAARWLRCFARVEIYPIPSGQQLQ